MLAVLPPHVAHLELATSCEGPLLAALARFKRLRTLDISGNGAGINWSGRGAAAVVPKLRRLRLDCRNLRGMERQIEEHGTYPAPFLHDHESALLVPPRWLAPATGLTSLDLVVQWGDTVPALCPALPALRCLRWAP